MQVNYDLINGDEWTFRHIDIVKMIIRIHDLKLPKVDNVDFIN